MHTSTLLTALLGAALVSAVPNMGPPKPRKTMSLAALNDCGCAIPAFFIQECQNIPTALPSKSSSDSPIKDCVCDRQWYGYSDACAECVNNANGRDEFPELVEFMGEFVSATKQLYSACTLTGGSVSSNGNAVCANTYYGKSCISIAADGKSGWASFEGSSQAKTKNENVTAKFELGEFQPAYKGQTLDVPDSGYPKKEEEKKDEDKETDKTTEKDEDEKDSSPTITKSGSSNSTSNSTVSGITEQESPINVNSGAQGTFADVKHIGFVAVFGVAISLLV